jgi:hypothetical protein
MDEKQVQEDHDTMIRVETKLDTIGVQFSNHLQHHWAITITALGCAVAGCINFLIGIIMICIKWQK